MAKKLKEAVIYVKDSFVEYCEGITAGLCRWAVRQFRGMGKFSNIVTE